MSGTPMQRGHRARPRHGINLLTLVRDDAGRSVQSSAGTTSVTADAPSGVSMESGTAVTREMLAVEIIAPRQTTREAIALETGMAALAHAVDRPFALELGGTTETRRFVVRAADTSTLEQVVRQLRARYPQAIMRPLAVGDDALRLEPGEAISAIELCPGAAPYLPLRTPGERQLAQEGADPLLGLMAAFGALRPGMRAIVQLALVPARDDWSATHQRLALEHPLEPERARERWQLATARMDSASPAGTELGVPAVMGLLVVLGLAVLIQRNVFRVPQWARQDGTALLHHQAVHLTSAQSLWLAIRASVVLVLLVVLLLVGAWVRGRLRKWLHPTQLYDPQLVRDKTEHVAYHARLRILVIGPARTLQMAPVSAAPGVTPTVSSAIIQTLLSLPSLALRFVRHVRRQGIGPRAQAGGRPTRIRRRQEGVTAATYHRVRRTFLARMLYGLYKASPPSRWRLLRRYTRAVRRARRRAWAESQRARADTQAHMQRRRDVLEGFIGTYRQFHLATGGYFRARRLSPRVARSIAATPHRQARRRACTGWTHGLARSTHVLSVADVAALWHLPQADDVADLPFVERSRARTLLAPAVLAHPESGAFRVGSSAHAGHILPVHLPSDATRRNMLAIAKTGKGKSTLLLSLARAALAERDSGLVLIDPHGDLAETVLALIPDHRRDDVLLVDLGDRAYPIGLNPLDVTLNPDRDKAVSNMIAVFSQIWKDFWGPRMESALEAALKTLHEVNQAEVAADPQDGPDRQFTLLDATPLMTYAAFRHSLLGRVCDPALTEYWMRFEALQPRLQQDIITPVTTKLDKFAHSVVARRIVGQGRSTLNMAEAIQQGRVVLVETARGIVGHDTSALVGATLLGLLQVTVGEQAAIPLEQRRRVRVVVDEFQTLEGVDFGAMLSELRKYGASFALATQTLAHLDALDRALRPTVMANLDQLFAFAMSAEDARMVERELDGVVESTDLITLDDFSCYARLTVDGRRLPVFSLALDPPPALDAAARAQADVLRRRSQKRIGRFVEAADTIIAHAAVRRKVVAEQHQHQQHQLRGLYVRDGQRGEGVQQVSSRPPAAPRRVATDEKMGAAEMGKTSTTSGTATAATAGSLLPEMTQGTGAPGNANASADGGAMETLFANSTAGGKPAKPVKRGSNRWSKKGNRGKKRRHANHGFDAMIAMSEDDEEDDDAAEEEDQK